MRLCVQFVGDVGVTEAVNPTIDSDVMYIAIGVGVGAALLVVVTATMILTAWCLVKKNRPNSGMYNIYID